MEAYVEEEYGSALVPRQHVDADGYRLGQRLAEFRQGHTWKGAPWESEAKAWAEALPRWHWNARQSDEYCKGYAQRGQEQSRETYTAFKTSMDAYVEAQGSALVPRNFVDADGCRLGEKLHNFRQGRLWKDTPWEDEAKAWVEALPRWHWNARQSDEWHSGISQRQRERSREAYTTFKAAMDAHVEAHGSALMPTKGCQLGVQLSHFREGHMWKGMPWEDEAKAWAEALRGWHWNARKSDEHRKGLKQRCKNQKARERSAELKRARLKVVPFVKSSKRRAEMRATSTDFSGLRGNAVLYMESEDGETIRRVQTDGGMGKQFIVGPVVDTLPVAASEAGPSDLNAYVSESESD
jgi:hypothetical protein